MPTATTFDALKAARDLEAAGVERRQADALGAALRRAAAANRRERATRGGVSGAKAEIGSVRDRLDSLHSEIAAFRLEFRLWSAALMALLLPMAGRVYGLL